MGGLVCLRDSRDGKESEKINCQARLWIAGAARSTELPGEVGSSLLKTSHLGMSRTSQYL